MINGQNIILRPICYEDTPNIIRWKNSPHVTKNFFSQQTLTIETHERWLIEKVALGEVVQFIIVDKKTGMSIGSTYLRDIDKLNQKAQFGIFIGEIFALGKGFGTEATQLITQYGFEKLLLNRIYLRVFSDNSAAIRSYEKVGFEREGVLRQDIFANGKYNDIIIMSKLKTGSKK